MPGKPLFSTGLKVIVSLLFLLFVVYFSLIARRAPMAAPYLLGQALGCLLIVGIFVAVGVAVRKTREKRKNPS